jgi:DNA-binding response OmpR family regulator
MKSIPLSGNGERNRLGTILVVEDDSLILALETAVLKRAGYRTLAAGDGVEGSVLFARHFDEIDALVTDISLPGMRGLEFAQFARRIRSDLKVLFASGSMEQETTAAKVKGSRYISKPFTTEEFLGAVHALLSERGAAGDFQSPAQTVIGVLI